MNAKRALLLLLLAAVALVGPQMTMMAGCQAAQVARQVVVTTTLPVPSSALPSPSRSPLPGMLGGLCSHNQSCQGPNLFCAFPNLLCGGPGVCSARPDLCTADFRPVCGCDFQTYSNPCAAATAGQAIFSNRACNTTRRCTRDNDCGSGFHCRFPAERCSGLGLCSEKPDACTLELNPVCGCNNQTYSNPCLAFSSGVSIQSLGECPVENAFACRSDEDCAQKQYCRFDAGSCGGEGTCINVPDTCTLELNPVCGCNNQTYDNPCIASSAGVSLISLGACEDVQPCMNDTECDFGQFCRFESGTCGGMGSCANAPTVCTLELNPVCGCDNVTYDSPCVAQASGVSILDLAPCQETTACSNDSDCAINEYCHFSMGQCGGNGSCASFPEACSLLLNPVCGCDGETHDSPCVAALAGTSVEFMGSCNATEGSSRCTTDSDCPAEDQFCQFTDGQCSGEGSCVDIPQFCTLELQPVCGCNGQTYNNRCRALAQGVSIRSANGACAAPVRPM